MVDAAGHSLNPGSASGPLPTGQEPLGRLWSVQVPGWLDPWAPQLADAFADGAWTAGWRALAAVAPLAGWALGFLFPLLWPGMKDIYSESLFFMAVVICGAILSGPVGVMLLLGYIVGDFLDRKSVV